MSRSITLGSDPEIAVFSQAGGYVPVCGLFGGDKGEPIIQGPEGGWLEDGVALELNPTPAASPIEAMSNVRTLIDKAKAKLKADTKNKIGLYYPAAYAEFEKTVLDKHPKACQFGCSEDFSAYEPGVPRQGLMEQAMQEFGPSIRFMGGHIHVGITDWPEELPKFVAVRLFDLLFGISYFAEYAPVKCARDNYYGQLGIYRETKYGFEYRTPCNSWLQDRPENPRVLHRALEVAKFFARFEEYKPSLVQLYNNIDWNELTHAANNRQWNGVRKALGGSKVDYGNWECLQVGDLFVPMLSVDPMFTKDTYTRKTSKPLYPFPDLNAARGPDEDEELEPMEEPDEFDLWDRSAIEARQRLANTINTMFEEGRMDEGTRLLYIGQIEDAYTALRERAAQAHDQGDELPDVLRIVLLNGNVVRANFTW